MTEDPESERQARPTGELIASRRIHTGRVISLDVDTVRFPNGTVGELEMVRHSGASAVVPFLNGPGMDPEVLLIRQYRYAADGYVYEIPAGRLDPDERPEECALRAERRNRLFGHRCRSADDDLHDTRIHR